MLSILSSSRGISSKWDDDGDQKKKFIHVSNSPSTGLKHSLLNFSKASSGFTKFALAEEVEKPLTHDCIAGGCQLMRINVSGLVWDMRAHLLNKHPTTLLGNSIKRAKYYDEKRNEYFIDRHRPSFEAIFHYYMYGGPLRRPQAVPDDIFLSEIEFYELEKEVVEEYKRSEGYIMRQIELPENEYLKRIWMLFEYPDSSMVAYVIAILSLIFTVLSIVSFCAETMVKTEQCVGTRLNWTTFFFIETITTTWFSIEVIARLISCPRRSVFFRDFKNVVDIISVLPYYVNVLTMLFTLNCQSGDMFLRLSFLRVTRLVRVFKLTKHSAGLQVLMLTFIASFEGLLIFLVALAVSVVVFSSTMYYVEYDVPYSNVSSIVDGFWYVIITMTTVGYGDEIPVSFLGRCVGGLCALMGALTLAIPVPIITENFNKFYMHNTRRLKQS